MPQQIADPATSHWGIKEHFERAALFFNTAMRTEDVADRFRFLIAAVYSCRAIAELMLDSKSCDDLGICASQLTLKLRSLLPYFELVYRIRIHDFHRFGLIPPSSTLNQFFALGPFKLTGSNGVASLQITDAGPVVHCTGKSKVEQDRPAFIVNDSFFDESSKGYVSLETIVRHYLSGVAVAVEAYESLIASAAKDRDSA